MIWRLLDNLLSRLVGRLLRLSPVDPKPDQRLSRVWFTASPRRLA